MVRFVHYRSCTFIVREAVAAYSTSPDDSLDELEEEITILAAHIHAATHRLLVLIAEFDRRRGWELGGHRSCAHWLSLRTGFDLGSAREKVRAALALTDLPLISASMRRGELSFSAVRALSRVATAENESDLLPIARGCTTAQVERLVRGWKLGSKQDEEERERERHSSRCLSIFPDDEGMYIVRGRLTPELGALLMRAVEAADDALYREKGLKSVSAETFSGQAAARRRADALGLMAERALAAGFTDAPLSGSRAERYQVLLHVDADTLTSDSEQGRSELDDGTRVSAETSRRITCDGAVVTVDHDSDGSVLSVGRRTRTISPALRRALEARDQGCRFPGCGLRFTDAHHVQHWADGGETSLENLLLLCRHHHRLVHEEGWEVQWWGGDQPAFVDPRGQIHVNGRRPSAPRLPSDPVASLIADTRARGADPDFFTAGARWEREADIPDAVYFRTMEAVG